MYLFLLADQALLKNKVINTIPKIVYTTKLTKLNRCHQTHQIVFVKYSKNITKSLRKHVTYLYFEVLDFFFCHGDTTHYIVSVPYKLFNTMKKFSLT